MNVFLWAGSDSSHDIKAHVAWPKVILPHSEGGMGVLDPEMQSWSSLRKVRGPTLRDHTGKLLLKDGIRACVPRLGG